MGKQVDWNLIKKMRPGLMGLNFGKGKTGVINILKNMLRGRKFHKALGTPEVEWHVFNLELPAGLVDLILFHIDNSVSLIEVITDGIENDVTDGISRLSANAFQFDFSAASAQVTKYLLAPVDSKSANALFAAVLCAHEDIEFVPMGTIAEHQREADKLLEKVLGAEDGSKA